MLHTSPSLAKMLSVFAITVGAEPLSKRDQHLSVLNIYLDKERLQRQLR